MRNKKIIRLDILDFEENKNALTDKIKEINENPSTIKLLSKKPKKYDVNTIFCLDIEAMTIDSIQKSFPNADVINQIKPSELTVYVIVE